MSTVKIKGNWNMQKGKIKTQLSNLNDSEDLDDVEEGILQNIEMGNVKKAKKKNNFKKDVDW
ncbi:MAG: CsbD family protein [Bacteroidota bacterium]|nr:CsbD family protein [Bacteroidota bacterium]